VAKIIDNEIIRSRYSSLEDSELVEISNDADKLTFEAFTFTALFSGGPLAIKAYDGKVKYSAVLEQLKSENTEEQGS
jgi:hypothetical protein